MKFRNYLILVFTAIILVGCGDNSIKKVPSNEFVLDAAEWFVEAAIDGDIAKMEEINHSEDWDVPADYVINMANETGVVDIEKDDYSLTEIENRVVAVSFGAAADPWILEFNKESTGYYFSNFLTLSDYEETLKEIVPQWIIEPIYFEVGEGFSNGLAPVRSTNFNWGYVNEAGELAFEGEFGDANMFSEGLASVSINETWGIIDEYGDFVVQPRFDYVGEFHGGLADFRSDWHSGKWGFIDKTGTKVIEPIYDQVGEFSEGLAWAEVDGKIGYIDQEGNWVIEPKFERSSSFFPEPFSEGLAIMQQDGKYGYINKTGEWVVKPKFLSGGSFHNGLAPVKIDTSFLIWHSSEYRYINQNGEYAFEEKFKYAYPFHDGAAAVENKDGQIGTIDTEGNWNGMISDTYIWESHNGVSITGDFDVMNSTGELIEIGLTNSGSIIIPDDGKLLPVCKEDNGQCGILNLGN